MIVRENSEGKKATAGKKVLAMLLCCGILVHNVTRSFQVQESFLIEGSVAEHRASCDNNKTTTGSTTSAQFSLSLAAETRLKRLQRYEERYNYKPPASYANHSERTELCGAAPNYAKFWSLDKKHRSLNDEDQTIYNLFFKNGSEKQGIIPRGHGVVEMGAYNGMQESNSRFFDVCLGWETLLVEGMPKTYEQLIKNRVNAHRFNFAPSCSEEDDIQNRTVEFDNYPMTNAGLGSVSTSYSQKNWTVEVPCGSLTNVLLDIFPHGHVSFFSLDVEGAEPLVLKHIDFTKVFVEVLIAEQYNNFCPKNSHCASRNEFRQIMKKNGYHMFSNVVSKSDLFIHPLSKNYLQAVQKHLQSFQI